MEFCLNMIYADSVISGIEGKEVPKYRKYNDELIRVGYDDDQRGDGDEVSKINDRIREEEGKILINYINKQEKDLGEDEEFASTVVIYNPLNWMRNEIVQLKIPIVNVMVLNGDTGEEIKNIQITPVFDDFSKELISNEFILSVFVENLPPFATRILIIKENNSVDLNCKSEIYMVIKKKKIIERKILLLFFF